MSEAKAYEERKKREKADDTRRGCLSEASAGCLTALPVIAAILMMPLLLR